MLQILLALLAGILTIAAPCILLPLPIILGGSVGQNSKTRPLFITLGFIGSFATVALLINFLIQKLGLNPNTLRTAAVILLGVFALFMIWPAPFERLMSRMSGLINRASRTGQAAGSANFGGFILGALIGIIWAPCAGPILGSILTLIALQKDLGQASVLLVAYAIGAGIPMLAIAYGGQALTTKVKGIAKYSHRLQQIFGVILILLAAAIYFQYDTVVQAKLVEKFPGFGTRVEKNLLSSFKGNKPAASQSAPDDKVTSALDKTKTMEKIEFKNLGPAPEFSGISHWLNSEPLTMQALRGKVVLVDFWTYSCINCVRTLPYITKWYDTYRDKGFVVIGVHTPEFAFEKVTGNVETAIKRHGIHYPVALDNDFTTWDAYQNQFWPAEYLIDQQGNIVYTHFGEGKYDVTEKAIQSLLKINGETKKPASLPEFGKIQSPEMYLGLGRLQNLSFAQAASPAAQNYVFPDKLNLNEFALEGVWKFDGEKVSLEQDRGKIRLHFSASKAYLVARSATPQTVAILVDGKPLGPISVGNSELYPIFSSDIYTQHILEIQIPRAGFQAFTFTFG